MTNAMLPRERCDFSAIVDRPPLKLPGNARLILWTIVNLEVWDIRKPMARQVLAPPAGQTQIPDVPNWSWHEYGMRVGVWRFFELFKRLRIRPTLALNARVCEDYPRVAEQARTDGWEFMGHSYEQGPIHAEPDQKAMIDRTLSIIERFCDKRPLGWLGPGLTETFDTPELLAAAGVKYIGDWVYDDEPTVIHTGNGPLHHPALHARTQRHPDDDRAASRERIFDAARHRSVRPAVCRGRAARKNHGAGDPSLHQRPAAPDQISGSDLRARAPFRRRGLLDRRGDRRLVSQIRRGTRSSDGLPASGFAEPFVPHASSIRRRRASRLRLLRGRMRCYRRNRRRLPGQIGAEIPLEDTMRTITAGILLLSCLCATTAAYAAPPIDPAAPVAPKARPAKPATPSAASASAAPCHTSGTYDAWLAAFEREALGEKYFPARHQCRRATPQIRSEDRLYRPRPARIHPDLSGILRPHGRGLSDPARPGPDQIQRRNLLPHRAAIWRAGAGDRRVLGAGKRFRRQHGQLFVAQLDRHPRLRLPPQRTLSRPAPRCATPDRQRRPASPTT